MSHEHTYTTELWNKAYLALLLHTRNSHTKLNSIINLGNSTDKHTIGLNYEYHIIVINRHNRTPLAIVNLLEANLELTELSNGSTNLVVELSANDDDDNDVEDDNTMFEWVEVDKKSDELERGTDEDMAELDEATEEAVLLDTNTPLDDDDHWESDDGLMNDLVRKTWPESTVVTTIDWVKGSKVNVAPKSSWDIPEKSLLDMPPDGLEKSLDIICVCVVALNTISFPVVR